MTHPHKLTDLAAKLSAFGIDAVDLDMIRRGDMLGPKLGAKVFAALADLTRERDEAGQAVDAFSDICIELGVERDNEAGLMAAHDLKFELTALRAKLERAKEGLHQSSAAMGDMASMISPENINALIVCSRNVSATLAELEQP